MAVSKKARKEITWILFFMLCVPLCYLLVFGEGGYLSLLRYREELQRLNSERTQLRLEQRNLHQKIQKIRQDPQEKERIAREHYNFARPGDYVVHVPKSE